MEQLPITRAHNRPQPARDSRFQSIPARFMATSERMATQPAYFERESSGWQATSWQDYARQVRQAARALVALGVRPGDAVCILGFNRPEWTTMDLAAMMVGAIPTGIYWSSAANEIAYIVEHSGCSVLLVENSQQWLKASAEPQALAKLRATVLMRQQDGVAPADEQPGVAAPMAWEQFMALGTVEHEEQVRQRMNSIQQTDIGTLIYTSGTTGHPKAVELTHANLSWTSAGLSAAFQVGPQDRLISYLPLAHIAEQLGSICNHALAGYQLVVLRPLARELARAFARSASDHLFWRATGLGKNAGGHFHQTAKCHRLQGPHGALGHAHRARLARRMSERTRTRRFAQAAAFACTTAGVSQGQAGAGLRPSPHPDLRRRADRH